VHLAVACVHVLERVYEGKKHFLPKDMLVDRKYKKEETNNNQTGESPDNTSNIPSKISIYRKIIWWQLLLLNVFFPFTES
jgi:hypothetical protein